MNLNRVLAALILVAAPATVFAYDIRAYCIEVAEAAGDSYQIEEQCQKMEMAARSRLLHATPPARIERYCEEVGEAAGGSFQIKETCIKMETRSKERMQR